MLSTFRESKKGCSGESYSSLMFNSDVVQRWSAIVPTPSIGLIELGMATVGRFFAAQRGLTAVRHDVAVHEAGIGHFRSFGDARAHPMVNSYFASLSNWIVFLSGWSRTFRCVAVS
jgi:hypothetical protein